MGQNAALSRKEYYSNAFVPLCSDHISELNVRLNRENPSPLLPPRRPPAIVLLLLDNAPLAPSSNYLVCLLAVWRHSTKMVIKIWICCTLLHGQLRFCCMRVHVWRRRLRKSSDVSSSNDTAFTGKIKVNRRVLTPRCLRNNMIEIIFLFMLLWHSNFSFSFQIISIIVHTLVQLLWECS